MIMAKRQVFYSFHYANDVMRVQQIRNIGMVEGNSPVSPNAVSYTHLDVYKRQSIRFELSFMNMATDASNFEKMVRIPYQKDCLLYTSRCV